MTVEAEAPVSESTYELPADMGELIRLALQDLEWAEQRPGTRVDMGAWLDVDHGRCWVCLAGAVMLHRLLPKQLEARLPELRVELTPGDLLREYSATRAVSTDAVRVNNYNALRALNIVRGNPLPYDALRVRAGWTYSSSARNAAMMLTPENFPEWAKTLPPCGNNLYDTVLAAIDRIGDKWYTACCLDRWTYDIAYLINRAGFKQAMLKRAEVWDVLPAEDRELYRRVVAESSRLCAEGLNREWGC